MSKIVKTWDGHQGELLYIKGKIAFIKESNGEVWFCLKTDIIDFDEINMEEYYVKDAGKITYIYGVDLEEHKMVIEKQQKRIAELEKQLDQLKQQLAETEQEFLVFQEDSARNEQIYIRELAEKDCRIEELEGQFAYECECNKQLVELQKQLEEKQNTIDEINKEFVQAVHDWKALCAKKDEEIEKLRKGEYQKCCQHCEAFQHLVEVSKQDANDLAIQELEKVHAMLVSKAREVVGTGVVAVRLYTINEVINQQIKELKGENK